MQKRFFSLLMSATMTLGTASAVMLGGTTMAVAAEKSAKASYYGKKFHGRTTANGEKFDMHAMTAAHKKLPFGTKVKIVNPSNNKSVVVRINDRGPYIHGRSFDLSKGAAQKIGLVKAGVGKIKYQILR